MLRALQLNGHQLSQTLTANGHSVDSMWEPQHALKLHSDWLRSSENDQNTKNLVTMAGKVAKQYILALQKMSSRMTASLSSYDLYAMICGLGILVQNLHWTCCGLFELSLKKKTVDRPSASSVFLVSGVVLLVAILHLLTCSSTMIGGSDILCSANSIESFFYISVVVLQTGVTAASVTLYFSRCVSSISSVLSAFPLLFQKRTHGFLVTGTLLHTLSLLSSSFVEEEHQTWYFFTSTLSMIIFCEKSTLFWTRENVENSDLFDANAFKPLSVDCVDSKSFEKCRSDNSVDRGKQLVNADFPKDRNTFTDETLDGLDVKRDANSKMVTNKNAYYLREGTQRETRKNGVLRICVLVLLVLSLARLCRVWNQTGIKWADRPDIGDWLVKPENKTALSVTYFISLLFVISFRYYRQDIITSVLFIVGVAHAYLYRTVTGSVRLLWLQDKPITKGITEARVTYFCVVAIMVWNVILLYKTNRNSERSRGFKEYIRDFCGSLEGLLSAFLLLQVLLQRPHNAAVLAVFVIQEKMIAEVLWKSEKPWAIVLSSVWMGHAMYFCLGNSNSLASVDISAGYVGLKDFIPGLMLPLTYLATYCGPCLWLMAGGLSVIRNARDVTWLQKSLLQVCYVIILCQALVHCVYCTLVFGQRYHLFVWSVFSPKLLYEASKTLLCALSVISVLCLMHFPLRKTRFDLEKTK